MTRYLLTLLALLGLVCTTTAPLHADLVGYWNFDGNVDDQSGMENDGEIVDASYDDEVPPQIGSGQSVNFEDDFAHVFIEADPSLESETFTLAMFVYDRGQVGALERLTSREGDRFETAINVHPPFNGTGEYAYYSGDGGGWQWSDTVPPLEEWQHVAYVADADEEELNIYVDGSLVYTTPDPWFTFPTGFMHIGNRWNDVEGFDGLMDDVAMWDEVLDSAAIKTIAECGVECYLKPPADGDYNNDGNVDVLDIDLQSAAMKEENPDLGTFDENGDEKVDIADRLIWIGEHAGTWVGDANLDGEFNSGDFVIVFTAGLYDSNDMAGWAEGDWDGNMLFNSGDFVAAFTDGGYDKGRKPAVAAVPEPSGVVLLILGVILCCVRRR